MARPPRFAHHSFVFALAGNGTWFVYLLATLAILLIGFCVAVFARIVGHPRFV